MLDFTGKCIFVNGAGSVGTGIGNGRATAMVMARQGAHVFATDLVSEALAETVRLIQDEGGIVVSHPADATSMVSMKAAMGACIDAFGGLDVMVNNVGGSAPGGAAEMDEDQWSRQIAFNLSSAFIGCKLAIPHLLDRGGGAIVNLASIAAVRMSRDRTHVAYSAAKQGVIGLSKSIAVQHAAAGIRCNTVIPGLINTPLVETRLAKQLAADSVESLVAKRNAQVPMGRMGTCWDIANAIVFLASDEAAHITGTELLVDGGIAAAMT